MNLNNETFRNKVSLIRGARKIGPKNQYLISTGLPSLDAILGMCVLMCFNLYAYGDFTIGCFLFI